MQAQRVSQELATLGVKRKWRTMQAAKSQLKTSLAHLPRQKQEELAIIQEIILKHVPAEMIIRIRVILSCRSRVGQGLWVSPAGASLGPLPPVEPYVTITRRALGYRLQGDVDFEQVAPRCS